MSRTMSITVKLYSGLDRELGIPSHDLGTGLIVTVPAGKRLRHVLKRLGMTGLSQFAYFRNGERISQWTKLGDGDEISCLRPSGGG